MSPIPPPTIAPTIGEGGVEAVLRCPSEPTTSLASLDFQANWALLSSPEIAEDMRNWQVLGAEGETTSLNIVDDAADWISFAGVSPGRRDFAYYTVREGDELLDLWVRSVSGGDPRLIAEGLERRYVTEWINDETIAVFDGGGGAWFSTWIIIDTMTGERHVLPAVWLEFAHAFSPDASELIYLALAPHGGRELRLREFPTGSDYRIFPWVDPARVQQGSSITIQWSTNGVTVTLMDARSITVALNIPRNSLTAEAVPTRTLLFPRESTEWAMSRPSDAGLIALWRGFGQYLADPDAEWEFLVLDTTVWQLYNYCLPPEWRLPHATELSPDGRFLSISRTGIGEVGTILLDSRTGQRAFLAGLGVWGWTLIPR
jgi:hypothetical protein